MSKSDDALLYRELCNATPEQVREALKFRNIAATFWKIPTKSGGIKLLKLNRVQRIIDAEYEKQMDMRGYVRMMLLKARQGGSTTYWVRRALHYVGFHEGTTALTIAHEKNMPTKWIRDCRPILKATPQSIGWPNADSVKTGYMRFANSSTYYIGSVQAGFTGVGDCIHFLHLSEICRYDKSGINCDVNAMLGALEPAVPSGDDIKGTVKVFESTGMQVGDAWYDIWTTGKQDPETACLFLPWYLVGEYRSAKFAKDVIEYNEHEKQMKANAHAQWKVELSDAQLGWYRDKLRSYPYYGDLPLFMAEYPTTEAEAFTSPGQFVYDHHHTEAAELTIRDPEAKYYFLDSHLGKDDPAYARKDKSENGEVWVWELPIPHYHYVVGADCMWGHKDGNDFAVHYVECLETKKLCARYKGQCSMVMQAWRMAALAYWYNEAVLAPERNGKAARDAEGVMNALLGGVFSWRYDNVWVRAPVTKFRQFRPVDYGWWTDHNTKGDLISHSMGATLDHEFDWADDEAVSQMRTIITHENGNRAALTGGYDDCWFARILTAEVARRERLTTELYVEPVMPIFRQPTLGDRLQERLRINQERVAEIDDKYEEDFGMG